MTPQELREEFEQEMKEEAYQEYQRREDFDYLLDENHSDILEAKAMLTKILNRMNSYGWDISNEQELLGYV